MSSSRNKFHSDFKIAVATGLIPVYALAFLPKSTRYNLLNISPEEFADLIGLDYSSLNISKHEIIENFALTKRFAQSISSQRLFKTIFRVHYIIISIYSSLISISFKDLKIKRKVINCINRFKHIIGFDRALRYFNISKSAFYSWSKQLSLKCFDSPVGKCLKIWTTQLTKIEVDTLKNIITEKLKLFWPLSSIWGFAFSKNIISFSYSTFLKYVKILKLDKNIYRFKRTRKTGLVSSAPNQFWNADVTIYKLLNGLKAYIYLLIDNFSNYILSWRVSAELSSAIRKETVEQAYLIYGNHNPHIIYSDVFPLLNAELTIENYYTHLITDGGPENKGELDIYLNNPDVKIRKLIALQDIDYSNSAIEALNKTAKYQYLHLKNIPDIQALISTLDTWIPIYNIERPNCKGKYLLTPSEIYNGKTIDKTIIKTRLIQAKNDRIIYNKLNPCGVC